MCRRTLLPGALMSICGLDFGTSNTTLGTMCRRPASSKVTPSARSGRASPLRRFYDMGQGTEVSTATLFAEHASASRPNYSDRSKPGFLSQCENELLDESRSGKPTVVIIL